MATTTQSRFERLGILYAFALLGIAAAIALSQVYLQGYISQQENNSPIVNMAGRQRMLSQKISKVALQLATTSEPTQRIVYTQELEEALSLWTTSHQTLLNNGVIRETHRPGKAWHHRYAVPVAYACL